MSELPVSKQKPLVLAIRFLIATSFIVGSGTSSAEVNVHLPNLSTAPANLTSAPVTKNDQGTLMTIDQKHHGVDKVTLDWDNFNIDKGYHVNFDQNPNQIALNNIHQADASKILGSLTAGGQVYLINQNGFLFGKDSQVNVNSLVASTLGISNENLQLGITKVFDTNKLTDDYLNKAAALKGNGELYLKGADGKVLKDSENKPIKIEIFIENGAKINTSTPGGRVILAAPVITNAGEINTPDGQTILAASKDKVYLQETGPGSDIRGLLVEVGTGGDVNNLGKVIAERGNASLLGFAVNQHGTVSASTSLQLNGSVRLLAREGILVPAQTGGALRAKSTQRLDGSSATVRLFKDSLTSVELDSDKTAKAIDAQVQAESKIELSGHKIVLKNGSNVKTHSGNVSINAVDDIAGKHTARIYLEAGSKVDVSGLKNVAIPVDRNILEVELRKNELRDSPLQRDGVLYGQKVAVDLRETTLNYSSTGALLTATIPIADVKGAVDRIARNIDERSTIAGSIDLNSSGDVITQAGSVLDFSGGSVAYQAGNIESTQLGSSGQLFDIAHADPNRHYDKIITSTHYDPGYLEGKAGGQVTVSSYEAVLDGSLKAKTITGELQREVNNRPEGSSFTINLNDSGVYSGQDIVFDKDAIFTSLSPDDPISRKISGSDVAVPLQLNDQLLNNSGLSQLNINTSGSVAVNKNASLNFPALGGLNWSAEDFNVQGKIIAPSGSVNLQALHLDGIVKPSAINLGATAVIDVSGVWVNDRLDTTLNKKLSTINIQGGSVKLVAEQGDLILEKGSRIEASGGAWSSAAHVVAGEGGSISLATVSSDPITKPGSLNINGDLSAWGIEQGGQLSINTNEVLIGTDKSFVLHPESKLSPLVLGPGFFQQGGFSTYNVTANFYGLTVADNVTLRPIQVNRQLSEIALNKTTGSHLSEVSKPVQLPDFLRHPTNLALSYIESAGQKTAEALRIGHGTSILADTQSTITLNSDTSVFVDGIINAPAGNININIKAPTAPAGYLASQGIWLGADSQLFAQGHFKKQLNVNGIKTGDVLAGGIVSLNANRGYIISRSGSLIDVSGTVETLTFLEPSIKGDKPGDRKIYSDGGVINLTSGEGMLVDGNLKANSIGGSSAGGVLNVSLDRNLRQKPNLADFKYSPLFPDDINPSETFKIEVLSDEANVVPENLQQGAALSTKDFSGRVFLKSSVLNDGGFDSLSLKTDVVNINNQYTSAVLFKGDVTTGHQIVLDTPSIESVGGSINLSTAYAILGSSLSQFNKFLAPDATSGTSELTVKANAIDLIGGLATNGFAKVNLKSTTDIRLRGLLNVSKKTDLGQFNVAGDLDITAQQVYPATLTDFKINVSGSGNESIAIHNSPGISTPVLSAGGRLTLNAPNIIQEGTLKVPFGELNLNADKVLQLSSGSVTSVTASGAIVPFGRVSGGTTWLYPLDNTGNTNLVEVSPPEKHLQLKGSDIHLQSGSTIDLSGGGDLYAYEFITGAGGSNDVLDPTVASGSQKFAVLPAFNSALTPYDPLESATAGLKNGQSVYLGSGSGLSAGWYTLLPAHYALLPGAYLVTPKADTQDQFQTVKNLADSSIVPGYYGVSGTNIASSRTQGFIVEPGVIARARSEYKDYFANQFFHDKALAANNTVPQLPQDAGALLLTTENSLVLNAELLATPYGSKGLGGQVDISADQLEVVPGTDLTGITAGTVGILSSDLNKLNAPSLLLGGKRSKELNGQRINVLSDKVKIDQNVHLNGQEIILAAISDVTVSNAATLESTGTNGKNPEALLVSNKLGNSDSAILRVSNAGQVDVFRDKSITNKGGVLTVESGARLKADGSLLVDSSQNTVFDGVIDMTQGSLSLNSSRISLGVVPDKTPGLVLKNTSFNLDDLRLNSAHDLDIYGSVNFNSKQVTINAANINGFDDPKVLPASSLSTITATNLLKIQNQGATTQHSGQGTGTLKFDAKNIQLGTGEYAIKGFKQVSFVAKDGIQGVGQVFAQGTGNSSIVNPGNLTIVSDVTLDAGYFSGANGATTSINATGFKLDVLSSFKNPENVVKGLGVSWYLQADKLNSDAVFDLPSGYLGLTANDGDINLGKNTNIDLSGQVVTFENTIRASQAGSLLLSSKNANINFNAGAKINLLGAQYQEHQVSNSGDLSIQANKGTFEWSGDINAKSASLASDAVKLGQIQVDVNSLSDKGFSDFNTKLSNAGLSEKVIVEQRSGNVVVAQNDIVKAHNFELNVDKGSVTINGQIDASGSVAGQIAIYGRNGIALGAPGSLVSTSTGKGKSGGSVLLDTVHRDDSGIGVLDLSATGGQIDVSSGLNGTSGSVHLRTGRDDNLKTIAVSTINAKIMGADSLHSNLEAVRIVTPADQVNVKSTDIIQWQNQTTQFMASRPNLTGLSDSTITLLPGIEVRSSTNLVLQDKWDFMDGSWFIDQDYVNGLSATDHSAWNSTWRYADSAGFNSLPGFLTFRATENIDVKASLTDAFANTPIPGQDIVDPSTNELGAVYHDALQPGQSWSYKLVAGKNINLYPSYGLDKTQVMVRTGTGAINLTAGADINFKKDVNQTDAAAAVYTIGTPSNYTRAQLLAGSIPGISARITGETDLNYLNRLNTTELNKLLRYGYFDESQLSVNYLFAEYPTQGGDINLSAKGNISGIQTGQQIGDWLVRAGFWNEGRTDNRPTAWGIDVSGDVNQSGLTFANGNLSKIRYFNQNVGALGGGNVQVNAGGNVQDLSVMLPTTGKPFGSFSVRDSNNGQDQWATNSSVINGGGDLKVKAGKDIVGGEYYVAQGTGILEAGGSISKSSIPNSSLSAGALLEMGDAKFNLQARQDVNIASVMNPTITNQNVLPDKGSQFDSQFFTYGPESGVNITATAGNVVLVNDFNEIKALKKMPISTANKFEYQVYPGSLNATALSGDIRVDNAMTLFPSAIGDLTLLANGNIGSNINSGNNRLYVNMSDTDPKLLPNIKTPVTEINGSGTEYLARELLNPASAVSAKLHALVPVHKDDVTVPLMVAKNGNIAFPSDFLATFYLPQASVFKAGKDISNLSILAQNLSVNDVTTVSAGRNISFETNIDGDGKIVTKTASAQYFKLAGPGQLEVLAGKDINLGGSDGIQTIGNFLNQALVQTGATIEVIPGLSNKPDYLGFIKKYQADYATELKDLADLTEEQQGQHLSVIFTVLFKELKASASAAAVVPENQRAKLYKRGTDAIHALFPTDKVYAGDLSLVFSQLKTIAGGDLNIVVPGGKIDVGLAGTQGGVSKGADQLGIVVQQTGDINVLTSGDVNVNQSRLFTMGGGDIAAWSTLGNIDAGKGAKSAISAPKPVTTIDANGNIKTIFPPIFSGSGIQAIGGGDVTLAAPNGVVDAGEAGISGGHVTIAATAVIGASNISSSSGTVGVPTTVSAPVSLAGANSAAASATKNATQSADDDNKTNNGSDGTAKKKVSIISADIVGFGDCSVNDVKEGKNGCGA